jgi:hypothetical protein
LGGCRFPGASAMEVFRLNQSKGADARRDVFISGYLTLIGIIQALVFSELADNYIGKQCSASALRSQKNLLVPEMDFSDPFACFFNLLTPIFIATFMTIIVVTYDYISYISIARKNIKPIDIIAIFVLGIFQFWLTKSLTDVKQWWAIYIMFSFSGVVAYYVSYRHKWIISFDGDEIKANSHQRHLLERLILTVMSAILGLFVYASVMHADFIKKLLGNAYNDQQISILGLYAVCALSFYYLYSRSKAMRRAQK